jgi:putative tricarboxylic transport membrane protein
MRTHPEKRSTLAGALLGLLLIVPAAAAAAGGQEWLPRRAVEIVVGTAPSGGADRPARVIQKIIQDQRLVPVAVAVINKPGAGGAIANVYLNQHAGDAHYISVAPPTLITNYLSGKSTLSYEDLTTIAIVASEYVAFAVKADSSLRTARDLRDKLARDPAALSIGIGTSVGNNNHAAIAQFARKTGIDVSRLKTVAFNSPGEVMVALMGGHLDMAALAVSNLVGTGNEQLRIIAIAAPRRLGGALAGVPTLREQGFDVVGQQWRAIIGPKGLSAEQVSYWERVFKAVVASEEWKQYLESVANDNTFLLGNEAKAFLNNENEDMKALLGALQLIKPPPASGK